MASIAATILASLARHWQLGVYCHKATRWLTTPPLKLRPRRSGPAMPRRCSRGARQCHEISEEASLFRMAEHARPRHGPSREVPSRASTPPCHIDDVGMTGSRFRGARQEPCATAAGRPTSDRPTSGGLRNREGRAQPLPRRVSICDPDCCLLPLLIPGAGYGRSHIARRPQTSVALFEAVHPVCTGLDNAARLLAYLASGCQLPRGCSGPRHRGRRPDP